MLTIGSLFSGIGGLELGVEQALAELGRPSCIIWQAEKDPYARAVLAKHWPQVHRYEDVHDIDDRAERPDILCGGFPCQDLSAMGKQAGLAGPRSGLWSEVVRIVRSLRPGLVFLENVPGIQQHLGAVLGPLAELGYDAEWGMFRASDVGAPHRRARWFCLAWRPAANALDHRCDVRPERLAGAPALSAAPRCAGWDAEPGVPRVDDGPASRLDSRRRRRRVAVLGNAVVGPQAARALLDLTGRAGLGAPVTLSLPRLHPVLPTGAQPLLASTRADDSEIPDFSRKTHKSSV